MTRLKSGVGALLLLLLITCLWGCSADQDTDEKLIQLINAEINGRDLFDNPTGIPNNAEIVLTFSKSVNLNEMEDAIGFSPSADFELSGLNQNTRVKINVDLMLEKTYLITITKAVIGTDGSHLPSVVQLSFSTEQNLTSICNNTSTQCQDTCYISDGTDSAAFHYYSSLSFSRVGRQYESIEMALIVVHGLNRNADDYYNYLLSSIINEGLEEKVVLVSPRFPENEEGDQLFWSSSSWREGQYSSGPIQVSSFTAVDSLIQLISNGGQFPNLQKIVVTGHSSGGLFTHLYSASNMSEERYVDLTFDYVVANSQYFYYPDGRRVQNAGGTLQLYLPQNCSGYDIWPTGFRFTPSYLNGFDQTTYNHRFKSRSVIYLLGDKDEQDPSLNTSNCYATLLGPTRYDRGHYMYEYMNLVYGSDHKHSKRIVSGIGHNGAAMYQSMVFRVLLGSWVGG